MSGFGGCNALAEFEPKRNSFHLSWFGTIPSALKDIMDPMDKRFLIIVPD